MRLLYSSDGSRTGNIDDVELAEVYRHRLPTARPVWLRSNFVTSLDGSITGADARAGSINTASDHRVFALHRAWADAVLVGAQTVRAEGYRAVDLQPWQHELRTAAGLSDFPLLVILTRSLDLDPALAHNGALDVGPVLILTTGVSAGSAVEPFLAAGIEVIQLAGADVDLVEVTTRLADRGHRRVLAEGGPRLHHDLLARGLVDELSCTLAPVIVGGDAPRTTTGQWLPQPTALALRFALHADDETVFLNYDVPQLPRSSAHTFLNCPC